MKSKSRFAVSNFPAPVPVAISMAFPYIFSHKSVPGKEFPVEKNRLFIFLKVEIEQFPGMQTQAIGQFEQGF